MIKKQIVSKGKGSLKPRGLVVHSTANPGATAQNHATYWKRGADYMTHYVSDWKEALQTVEDNRKCWHCGNGNSRYIGIEICEAKTRADCEKGWDIAVKAVRLILKKHGWTTEQMVSHDWVREHLGGTTHTDPLPYFNKWGKTWDDFVSAVNEKAPTKPKLYVNTPKSRLNMRQKPMLGSKVLKKLNHRAVVTVLKRGSIWTKCSHAGTTGYCATRYLVAKKPAPDYYPTYKGASDSIVVALNAVKVDSSFANRKKIATANGIKNYAGTAAQNTKMLGLLKSGTLKR